MNRRNFLSSLGQLSLTGLASSLPLNALASIQIGTAKLSSVSDGKLILPDTTLFAPMPQEELATLRETLGITGDQITSPCNASLLQTPDCTILFDVGSGQDFMPTSGSLLESLDALGVAPEAITDVVFTHAHPDHLWGLLDDFDDPVFTEARYYMSQTEFDYWIDPYTVAQTREARKSFAVGAKRRLEMIAEQIKIFKDGEEFLPGIAARATFGHTPGHMSFEVRSGTESTMVLGDCIGNNHVAFMRPDWFSGTDQDGPIAAETRKKLLDQLAHEQTRILGYHLPNGGVGRVERQADSYIFVSEDT